MMFRGWWNRGFRLSVHRDQKKKLTGGDSLGHSTSLSLESCGKVLII